MNVLCPTIIYYCMFIIRYVTTNYLIRKETEIPDMLSHCYSLVTSSITIQC